MSAKPDPSTERDGRQRIRRSYLLAALPLSTGFAVLSFAYGFPFEGWMYVIASAALCVGQAARGEGRVRALLQRQVVLVVLLCLCLAQFSSVVVRGALEYAIWVCVFPPIAFFVLGLRTGLLWTGLYALVIAVGLAGVESFVPDAARVSVLKLHTVLAYLTVVLLAALYERLCARQLRGLRRANRTMRASLDEVSGHERALEQANRELEAARDQAEASQRATSEFLAAMGHELRTPLNGITGMARLLLKTRVNREQEKMIETVVRSGDALLNVLNDILDVTRLESGHMRLKKRPFDIAATVESAVSLFAEQARQRDLELVADIVPGTPCHVVGDEDRMRQVLTNLVSNAFKFTHQGTIGVRLSGEARGDEAALRIAVSDSGCGIAPEDQVRVFEKFTQIDASASRPHPGLGLGLAICRSLLELSGGGIALESALGVGSTFTCALGLPLVPDRPRAAPAPLPEGSDVLVLARDSGARTALLGWLEAWGLRSALLASPQAALEGPDAGSWQVLLAERRLLDDAAHAACKRRFPVYISLVGADEPRARRSLVRPYSSLELARLLAEAGARQAREPLSSGTGRIPQPSGFHGRGARVLIVEDEELNYLVARSMLELYGCRVDWAQRGAEALERLATQSFSLVLMDCRMPGMDGYETTRRIRLEEAEGERAPVPIVAMTAEVLDDRDGSWRAAGMDGYLGKPLKPEDLERMLGRFVDGTGPREEERG